MTGTTWVRAFGGKKILYDVALFRAALTGSPPKRVDGEPEFASERWISGRFGVPVKSLQRLRAEDRRRAAGGAA